MLISIGKLKGQQLAGKLDVERNSSSVDGAMHVQHIRLVAFMNNFENGGEKDDVLNAVTDELDKLFGLDYRQYSLFVRPRNCRERFLSRCVLTDTEETLAEFVALALP